VKLTRRRRWELLIGGAWLLIILGAMGMFTRYTDQPGEPASAPAVWPKETSIRRVPGQSTLVLLAHPMCPCTRATLADLARLLVRVPGKVTAHVLFIRPVGAAADWETSDLWNRARAIPGVEVSADQGAVEAARFGGATSGEVLLYGPDGRLEFSGGITGSRGHEGDNPGQDRIFALLTTGRAELASAPVFGCPLSAPPEGIRAP
jgi:hypothetical protein